MRSLIFLLSAAISFAREPALTTGRTFTQSEMAEKTTAALGLSPSFGGACYAEINSAALPGLMAEFLRSLSQRGLGASSVNRRVGWDKRFNCYALAWEYVTVASIRLALDLFSEDSPITRPAMFVLNYHPDEGGSHSIVIVFTERGVVYIDPGTLGEVKLSAQEIKSRFFLNA